MRRYRWAILAAGTFAQASFSSLTLGLPAIAPALRDAYGLDLRGVGLLLAAEWVGLTVALLPWGLVTDRVGERWALTVGLTGCGIALVGIAFVHSFAAAAALLVVAGAVGGSVQSASGRAVMHWFAPSERGLAFGVRQMAVPLGGAVAAIALPALARADGLRAPFLFLASLCLVSAAIGAAVIRDSPEEEVDAEHIEWTLRDGRLWLLCGGSGFYVATQIVLFSFLVLFLHDARGLSPSAAAAVLAAVQVIAVGLRVGVGRWSDVLHSRIVPLRRIGVATAVTLGAAAALVHARLVVLLPLMVAAGALAAAWNGLSFVAAAELAGRARSGAAIGFQQTVLSVAGVAVPPLFAAIVQSTSWRLGFALAAVAPLAGWYLLGRVRERPS
jgi:sugar phosphate permease